MTRLFVLVSLALAAPARTALATSARCMVVSMRRMYWRRSGSGAFGIVVEDSG